MNGQLNCDVLVVGAGIGGLTSAAFAARAGAECVLLDSATTVGGRARTRDDADFQFNHGAHALYLAGAGKRVLDTLGVAPAGATPSTDGTLVIRDGAVYPAPAAFGGPSDNPVLNPADQDAFAAAMQAVGEGFSGQDGETIGEAILRLTDNPAARDLLHMLVRLTTFTNAPDHADAGAMFDQLRLSYGGVAYLHDGWGAMCHQLAEAARSAGARIETGAAVSHIEPAADEWLVHCLSGEQYTAQAIVLAVSPVLASEFAPRTARLQRAVHEAIPAHAACLDVGLSRLPDESRGFALGMGVPLYFSVHTRVARLAPAGAALVHLTRYLRPEERPNNAVKDELENLLDMLEPGWRDLVAARQWLPFTTVTHDIPQAARGGRAGRCPAVLGEGLFAAGDWVGAEGLLSDAAFASGALSGDAAAAYARDRRTRTVNA